jgi:hypothetical protein
MKKTFLSSLSIAILFLFIYGIETTGCKKETITVTVTDTVTNCIPNIQGLWEGTFTSVSGFPQNGKDYYFSLSVYKDSTCSYKSGSDNPNNFIYATGTWKLIGTTFSFTAKTLNSVGGSSVDVVGSATFNKSVGTLTSGTISSNTPSSTATWKMTKVN